MEPSSRWWLLLMRGLLALAFGIFTLSEPLAALSVLVFLFGLWALLDGVTAVALLLSGWRSWQLALVGVAGLMAALITFFRPGLTAIGLFVAIAAWSIARGVLEIVLAIELRRRVPGEGWLLFGGISSLGFGILMIAMPMAGVLGLAWLIGCYALLFGATMIALSVHLRRLTHPTISRPLGAPRMA